MTDQEPNDPAVGDRTTAAGAHGTRTLDGRTNPRCGVRHRGERPRTRPTRPPGGGSGFAAGAIEQARTKANARAIDVDFIVADAHDLAALGRRLSTVLDSALLDVITERKRYAEQLAHVTERCGRLILLEISDEAPIPYLKISQSEIRRVFAAPVWKIEQLSDSSFDTHLGTFPRGSRS